MTYPEDYINKVILGDCLEVMKGIPDKSIDLVLTDPPYGINAGGLLDKNYKTTKTTKTMLAKRKNYGVKDWDTATPPIEVFEEIIRVSKKQVIFGGQYFTDKLPQTGKWIIWDKKVEEKYQNDFADCEIAWTSENGAPKIIRYLWHGMIQSDMKNKEIRHHPTQKPVPVMEQLLNMFSLPDELVLDPFAGSGSTLRACLNLSRRFIGIEIDPKYVKVAEDRLKQQVLGF